MSIKNIVIIEDEIQIREILHNFFSKEGYRTFLFADGELAFNFIKSSQDSIDCFIIDRMLPNKSGLQICELLRKTPHFKQTPVMMLTALSSSDQIIEGLDAGADDYLTKPFDLNVLYARVRTLLRRFTPSSLAKDILTHENIKIDMLQCKVWLKEDQKEELIELTLSEFKILSCLMATPGKVFTRNQIVEYIQEGPIHVTDRTVDTHVFGLRKKLKNEAKNIETIRGIGYRLSKND